MDQHLVVVVEPHLAGVVEHTQERQDLLQEPRQPLQGHHRRLLVGQHSIDSMPCRQHNRHKPHKDLGRHSIAHTVLRNQLRHLGWRLQVLEQVLLILASQELENYIRHNHRRCRCRCHHRSLFQSFVCLRIHSDHHSQCWEPCLRIRAVAVDVT